MLAIQEKPARTVSLRVLLDLFERLHAEKIVYCHWKGNEHLGAALSGAKDVDLLVDRRAALALGRILSDTGFKRFLATPEQAYPGVEDYIALDPFTGKLAHLHLHYQLIPTKNNVECYRLPWEDLVLSTRRLDDESEIYVPDANIEIVLFLVRAALALRRRDIISTALAKNHFRDGALREFSWLAERVQKNRLSILARGLIGEKAARLLEAMVSHPPSVWQLLAFRRSVRPRLEDYRTYGRIVACWRRWSRAWQRHWRQARNRYDHAQVPEKRTVPHGGLIVAFLGADGSGKSTATKEITRWLSRKVDVVSIYFGSGDGPASLPRRCLRRLDAALSSLKALRRKRSTAPPRNPAFTVQGAVATGGPGPRSLFHPKVLWKILSGLALAREKRARLLRARRARNLGMIAICDRFPQAQIMGFNDGPLLSDWLHQGSRPLRAAARKELAAYVLAETCSPDLVIKLCVTPAVAWQRKLEMGVELLSRRAKAIHDLHFPPRTRVIEIDANQPLDEVLLQVKHAIWDSL